MKWLSNNCTCVCSWRLLFVFIKHMSAVRLQSMCSIVGDYGLSINVRYSHLNNKAEVFHLTALPVLLAVLPATRKRQHNVDFCLVPVTKYMRINFTLHSILQNRRHKLYVQESVWKEMNLEFCLCATNVHTIAVEGAYISDSQ